MNPCGQPTEEAPLDLSMKIKREPLSPERQPAYVDQYAIPACRYPMPPTSYYVPYPAPPIPFDQQSSTSTISVEGASLEAPTSSLNYPAGPSPSVTPEASKLSDNEEFQEFEENALAAMMGRNGGNLVGSNPRMRRVVSSTQGSSDESYRRQRERNNMAAKQSRDRRKRREIHLALKVKFLENQVDLINAKLAEKRRRCQIARSQAQQGIERRDY